MSLGPGRWQRLLLSALSDVGHFRCAVVADVGLATLDRSMTTSEYRALNRAAWLLQIRGALHVQKAAGTDYLGRSTTRVLVWTCPMCSLAGTSEHIAATPCFWCGTPTQLRDTCRPTSPDCGCQQRVHVPSRCLNCGRSGMAGKGTSDGWMTCTECAEGRTDALALAAAGVWSPVRHLDRVVSKG